MIRLLLLPLLIAAGAPAAAAQSSGNWRHAGSDIGAPAQVGEFRRTKVEDRFGNGLDMAVSFARAKGDTVLTLFLYQPAYADNSLWFDQAQIAIQENPLWKLPDGVTATPKPFRVGSDASLEGSVLSYAARGRASSTAMALVPVNGWLVKLRMSSKRLGQQELERKIVEAAQALEWPASTPSTPPLTKVADCAQRLVFGGDAEQLEPENELVQAAASALGRGPLQPKARLCRDQGRDVNRMVYREEGVVDGYLLAVGDTGRLARVRHLSGDAAAPYVVEFYDLGTAHVAGFFKTRPTPDQAFDASNAAFLGRSLAKVSSSTARASGSD